MKWIKKNQNHTHTQKLYYNNPQVGGKKKQKKPTKPKQKHALLYKYLFFLNAKSLSMTDDDVTALGADTTSSRGAEDKTNKPKAPLPLFFLLQYSREQTHTRHLP